MGAWGLHCSNTGSSLRLVASVVFFFFWCSLIPSLASRCPRGLAPESFDMMPVVFRCFFAFWAHLMLLTPLACFLPKTGITSYSKSPGSSVGNGRDHSWCSGCSLLHGSITFSRHFQFILIENWFFICLRENEFMSYFQFKCRSSEFLLLWFC